MSIEFDGSKLNARRLSAGSLAETTAQHMMDAIIGNKISPDEPFPSQSQLCESFGVSRTVIREATQILVSKGILDVQHGKRITIRPPSHEQIAESVSLAFRRSNVSVFDVLELRKILEVEAAALAAQRAEDDDLKRMGEALQEMERFYGEKKGYVDADVEFHRAIFAAARQPALDLVLSSLSDYLFRSRELSFQGPQNLKRVLNAHQLVYRAIADKDAAAARDAMRRHLEETEEDLKHTMEQLGDEET